jgi:hypothetical protein
MSNRFILCEDIKQKKLPVSVSSKIKNRIAIIYVHNPNSPIALNQ